MALKTATRSAQWPLVATFTANFNDTAVDSVTGAEKSFGADYLNPVILDAINLPAGASIVGGDMVVETAGVGPTLYTMKIGVAGDDACFLAATTLLATSRTALLLTKPAAAVDGKNVRITMASTVANATAGKFIVRVMYTIDGRANETNPN